MNSLPWKTGDSPDTLLHEIVTEKGYSRVAPWLGISRQATAKRDKTGYSVQDLAALLQHLGGYAILDSQGKIYIYKGKFEMSFATPNDDLRGQIEELEGKLSEIEDKYMKALEKIAGL